MAFVGGSHWYGTPCENSDIDLCILLSEEEAVLLGSLADTPNTPREGYGSFPIRFGSLNLIVCTDQDTYNAWLEGRDSLKSIAPVTKEQAISVFKSLRVSK